jgi:hypothetical protein
MASMAGLDELVLSLPQTTREVSSDGRHDLVAEAWLTRAQKRLAKAWLAQQS